MSFKEEHSFAATKGRIQPLPCFAAAMDHKQADADTKHCRSEDVAGEVDVEVQAGESNHHRQRDGDEHREVRVWPAGARAGDEILEQQVSRQNAERQTARSIEIPPKRKVPVTALSVPELV